MQREWEDVGCHDHKLKSVNRRKKKGDWLDVPHREHHMDRMGRRFFQEVQMEMNKEEKDSNPKLNNTMRDIGKMRL